MTNSQLLIAANTIWVVVAAILVMFMQAGFAFLEAGLTRMKNAAHIAGKNVLIFGVCSLVYWAVGFGIAFGDGNRWLGTSGFAPSVDSLLVVAAVLVMFMQAGFAFLEAGLTRMKNAAHIAGKNVLIFGVCSLVYWAVGSVTA